MALSIGEVLLQIRECVVTIVARWLAVPYPLSRRALRRCHPEWQARRWSNAELRRWGYLFEGDVINVSGWKDEDREGGRYRNYFPNCTSYVISNIGGARGTSGLENEIYLDLTAELPNGLQGSFDVVFNHTTLEHIYDVRTAIANLCKLTRDIIVLIVPFAQQVHWEEGSFLDYWRFTPFTLQTLLREHGLEVVYWSSNENPVYPQYILAIASRKPEKWRSRFPTSASVTKETAPGRSLFL